MTDSPSIETTIQERITYTQKQIEAACVAAGRSPEAVTLVAVSKTQPAEAVLAAATAGLTDFGENRVEESVKKIGLIAEQIPVGATVRWHMIGHIQSRKARLVVPNFDLVHSVDSLKLAAKLSRVAEETNRVLDVLLEVNVSGEASKYGWSAFGWQQQPTVRESLWQDIRSILKLSGICVYGLMTMAPIVPVAEQARPVFANLRLLRDALQTDFPGATWDQLSMGMTDDFPVAISEGATIVRIGRAIFGPRMSR